MSAAEDKRKRLEIAARLAQARKQAGLSQGQVAKLREWSRPTVSQIESGERRVSAEELCAFADMYGVSNSWILGEDESNHKTPLEQNTRVAAREFSKLRPKDYKMVLSFIAGAALAGVLVLYGAAGRMQSYSAESNRLRTSLQSCEERAFLLQKGEQAYYANQAEQQESLGLLRILLSLF